MKILADVTLPHIEALFTPSFHLTVYQSEKELREQLPGHDILLCRSTLRVSAHLLQESQIQCVATASSGTDHIDKAYLKTQGITLLDAKGCNARAVTDYVLATIASVDKAHRLMGPKAGIIGVGQVGSRVLKRLQAAGYDTLCFDPFKAQRDYCLLEALTDCDVLCIHANLHFDPPYPSANLLSLDFLNKLKKNVVIINAARGGIVNEEALLATTTPITYCTDVYNKEPSISTKTVDYATLCTPHIAGHSIEGKLAAVELISQQLHKRYGLPCPPITKSIPCEGPVLSPLNSWQDTVLSLYNPLHETLELKAATDKKQAFLTLRQAHQHQHDFNFYNCSQLSPQTKAILGV